jgi:hypothetical protein
MTSIPILPYDTTPGTDELKLVLHPSPDVDPSFSNVSLFIASPPSDFTAKVEPVGHHPVPETFDFASPFKQEGGGSLELSFGDLEPDWNSPDGLMVAILGEPPGESGLEISLNDGLFADAYKEASLSVFPVRLPQSFPASGFIVDPTEFSERIKRYYS